MWFVFWQQCSCRGKHLNHSLEGIQVKPTFHTFFERPLEKSGISYGVFHSVRLFMSVWMSLVSNSSSSWAALIAASRWVIRWGACFFALQPKRFTNERNKARSLAGISNTYVEFSVPISTISFLFCKSTNLLDNCQMFSPLSLCCLEKHGYICKYKRA